VKKGKTGNGLTTLEGIAGLSGVTDKLPPTEFQVGNSVPAALAAWEEELLAPWRDSVNK